MRKFLSMMLSLVLLLSLLAFVPATVAAASETEAEMEIEETEPVIEYLPNQIPEGEPTNMDPVALEDIKIGFVHVSDPSDQGYTYNHDLGTQHMAETLGLNEDQIINKFNVPETAECATALRELAEEGCHIIFATSFGFEDFVLEVAAEYPDIEFCHATGYQALTTDLPNVHNYFGAIYQARYLSGIAAGLKTETNLLGYVTAMPFAECISGFDAFYLGAKSVNPDVKMLVMYTNSWNDPTKEAQVAQALIDRGADVIGQHCDSTAPATTAQQNGVWHVGYNSDMIEAAPEASLTSAVWDWSQYLIYAVNHRVEATAIALDWSKGLADKVVDISALNEDIIAEGTAEAIEEAREKILSGEWDVFTGPLYDSEGNIVVEEGVTFVEPQSAPSIEFILEGITVVE